MELFTAYFVVLVLFNAALAYHRHHAERNLLQEETLALPTGDSKAAAIKFKREYFSVYMLVMAADWLQGPFLYTLYKHEKDMPEATVAALFTTGFVVAGITASFVGSLADRHGRKAACLTFCIAYALSCLSVLSNDKIVLFAGRALGGLSTTLLYSVFETWMISEYHKRDLSSTLGLGTMFGFSVTLSGVVAIIAGVLGEVIVDYTGTKTSPFMAAACCLVLAFICIHKLWDENFGEATNEKQQDSKTLRTLLADHRILALGLTTTIFEGCMYLYVFFWSPALISSRALANNSSSPPFGLIFSCFMCAMMLGSLIFSSIKLGGTRDAVRLMLSILAMASYSMLFPVLQRAEAVTFWSFALFEICVGLYFPTMSRLKSEIVEDSVRAKVYTFMRLPLNVFVVTALGLTKDGDAHRSRIFTAIGGLMLSAFWIVQRYLL